MSYQGRYMAKDSLSNPFQLRLYKGQLQELQAVAASRRMDVAALIRERLDLADRLETQLDRLFQLSLANAATVKGGAGLNHDAMLLELVLLLRAIAGPQRQGVAMAEVERQGLPPWRSTL